MKWTQKPKILDLNKYLLHPDDQLFSDFLKYPKRLLCNVVKWSGTL